MEAEYFENLFYKAYSHDVPPQRLHGQSAVKRLIHYLYENNIGYAILSTWYASYVIKIDLNEHTLTTSSTEVPYEVHTFQSVQALPAVKAEELLELVLAYSMFCIRDGNDLLLQSQVKSHSVQVAQASNTSSTYADTLADKIRLHIVNFVDQHESKCIYRAMYNDEEVYMKSVPIKENYDENGWKERVEHEADVLRKLESAGIADEGLIPRVIHIQ
jgi:hypothetical protein